jgi:hypothetical protein
VPINKIENSCRITSFSQWRAPRKANGNDLFDEVVVSIDDEIEILKSGSKKLKTYNSESPNFIEYLICEPYITHPLAVMDMMDTDEEKIVAVLHDVIEDTEYELFPFEGLWIQHPKRKADRIALPAPIYSALHKLTKFKIDDKSYKTYIEDIAMNKLTTKVKLADMFHNMSSNPSDRAKQKYLKAIPVLLANL